MCNYSFFIGIDVSKSVIDVSYYDEGSPVYFNLYANSKQGFEDLINDLTRKSETPSNEWFICFENTGSYSKALLHWLIDTGITCREESPLKISRSLGLRRGKDDKIDSRDICRYAYEKRDRLKASKLDKSVVVNLKSLLSRRELLVKHRTALNISLKEQKASMNKKLYSMLELENETLLKTYEKQIKNLEEKIQEEIASDAEVAKNNKLSQSVIGIGTITSAYIISVTNNFELFEDARKFACYCGVAPFPNSSGIRKGRTRVSHIANKKMKSLFSNCILAAISYDPEIQNYYKRKIKEGKKPGVVFNAIKNKLIQRVFAVIKRQSPYVKLLRYA